MASKKQSVPYRCPKCIAEGSYYGKLIFPPDESGTCLYHKLTPLEPAKQEGNK